jgi:hypothetical protein
VRDALVQDVPVERGLELGPVIGLDRLDLERQPLHDVVDELDGRLLVQLRVDPQHPQPGAVVDRGELVALVPTAAPAGCADDGFDELDVDLHVMAGPLFLVPLPPLVVPLVALGGGQPAEVESLQNAPHAGLADRDVVVAAQVHDDLLGSEVVVLPQVQIFPTTSTWVAFRLVLGRFERVRSPSTPSPW